MQMRHVALIVFIFAIFQFSLIPLQDAAVTDAARDNLRTLSSLGIPHEPVSTNSTANSLGFLEYVKAPANYFVALYNVVMSDTPVFQGGFEYIRWLVFTPIMAAICFGLIMLFFNLFWRLIS